MLAVVALLATTAVWATTSSAATHTTVTIAADGTGGAGGIDLARAEADVKADIAALAATATPTLELPPGISGSLVVQTATIDTSTSGELTVAGSAMAFGDVPVDVVLTSTWSSATDTSPATTVAATVSDATNFSLADLNSSWVGASSDPVANGATITFAATGTTIATNIDLTSVIGTAAAGLGTSSVDVAGSISGGLDVLGATPGVTGSLALGGDLSIGTSPPAFPAWLSASTTPPWTLQLDFTDGVSSSIAGTVAGAVTSSDGSFGVPATPVAVSGTAAANLDLTLSGALPATVVNPLGQTVSISSPTLEIDLTTADAGISVDGASTTGSAPGIATTVELTITTSPNGSPAGTLVADLVETLDASITLANWGSDYPGLLDAETLSSIGTLPLVGLVERQRSTTEPGAAPVLGERSGTARVTYFGRTLDMTLVITENSSGALLLDLVMSSRPSATPFTLGDLDGTLFTGPIGGIALDNAAIVLTNHRTVDAGQPVPGEVNPVPQALWDAIVDAYCDPTAADVADCLSSVRVDFNRGVTLVAGLPTPDLIDPFLGALAIPSSSNIVLTGQVPLFAKTHPVSLLATLPGPEFSGNCNSGQPNWLTSANLSLGIQLADSSIGMTLGGSVGVRMEKSGADIASGNAECGGTRARPDDYDYLTFGATVSVDLTAETDPPATGVRIRFRGGLFSTDPDGWQQAFGLEWLTIKNLALVLGADYKVGDGVAPGLTLTFGVRGDAWIGDTDFDSSFLMAITPTPPSIRLQGFRLRSQTGVDLNDLAYLASRTSGLTIDPASLGIPNIGVKRIELAYAEPGVDEQALCLFAGLVPTFTMVGELYIPPSTTTPPLLDADISPLPDQCQVGTTRQPSGLCITQREQDAGCFAGVEVRLSDSGLIMNGQLKALDLGPIHTDPTVLNVHITTTPRLYFSAGVTIDGPGTEPVGTGSILIDGRSTGFEFSANLNIYNTFFAQVEGSVPFDGTGPISVTGFMEQRIGDAINQALEPVFRSFGGTIVALSDVITTFRDPTQTLDDVAADIIAAPAKIALAAAQDPSVEQPPEWLSWLIGELEGVVADVKAEGGGEGAITTAVNALMEGVTVPISDRVEAPALYVPELCNLGLGTWVGSSCYTVPPSHWTIPIPGAITAESCLLFATLDAARNTCYYPAITLTIPGLCAAIDGLVALGVLPENPFTAAGVTCNAAGVKELLARLFDDAFLAVTGVPYSTVDTRMRELATALSTPGFKLIDIPCTSFSLQLGQATKNSFDLDMHLVIFNSNIYLDALEWDFDKTAGANALAFVERLTGAFFSGGDTPPPEIPCDNPTTGGGGAVNVILPPADLSLSGAGSVAEGSSYALSGTFADPTGSATDSLSVSIDWGDGTSTSVTPTVSGNDRNGSFSSSHVYRNDQPNPRRTIRVTVVNNSSGSVRETKTINITNVNPVIASQVQAASSIDEGDTLSLSGVITDVGIDDTPTATVNWGDGSSSAATIAADGTGRWAYVASHVYVDDRPGSAADTYPIRVTVDDGDGGTATRNSSIGVANVAPVAVITTAGGSSSFDEGTEVDFTVTVADPGVNDVISVLVDWGDGTTTTVPGVSPGTSSFTLRHPFADDNPTNTPFDPVNVIATATDDDGGTTTRDANLTIHNVVPSAVEIVLGDEGDMFHENIIDENDRVLAVVRWVDPGIGDSFTATLDWGDGTPVETVTVSDPPTTNEGPNPVRFTEFRHQYLDDPGTGTDYVLTATVHDDDEPTAIATGTESLQVDSIAPVLSTTGPTVGQQYSDPFPGITLDASDVLGYVGDDLDGSSGGFATRSETLAASTRWRMTPPSSVIDPLSVLFPPGTTAWTAGLPRGLSMSPDGCAPDSTGVQPRQTCGWSIDGIVDMAPGAYEIELTVVDDDGVSSTTTVPFTVVPEDARTYYTGPSYAATTSARDGETTIGLRTTVTDISYESPTDTDPGKNHQRRSAVRRPGQWHGRPIRDAVRGAGLAHLSRGRAGRHRLL